MASVAAQYRDILPYTATLSLRITSAMKKKQSAKWKLMNEDCYYEDTVARRVRK